MVDHLGSKGLVVKSGDHVWVWAIIWDWVVNWVAELWLLVLVLVATCRGANWIRLNVNLITNLQIIDNPLMSEFTFSIRKMLGCSDHVSIKSWSKVIVGVLSNIVPFSL